MKQNVMSNQSNRQFYAWLVISISALFLIYKYILQVYPSVMTNELMRAFHVYGVGLGNLAATFFYAYLITQLFVGVILDKYSVRIFSAIAILVSAAGAYLFSIAHHYWLASLARAMMGFGAAFATVSYMKIAAVWFRPNQFAFVAGLLATAAMLGAIFGETPLALMVNYVGWRQTIALCALLGIVIATLFVLIVRDKPVHKPLMTTHKASITLQDVLSVFKNKQNWILTFYSGLAFSPVAVFGGLWGNPFLEEAHHMSRTEAASFVSLVFFGLAIGGPLLGYISDRIGSRRKMMYFGTFLSLVSITPMIYVLQLPFVIMAILLFLFGFGTGAFMLGFAVGKEINKAALAATVVALINTGDAIFGAVTEPMVGKFLDLGWSGKMLNHAPHFLVADFQHALLILPIYLLVALILVRFTQEMSSTR